MARFTHSQNNEFQENFFSENRFIFEDAETPSSAPEDAPEAEPGTVDQREALMAEVDRAEYARVIEGRRLAEEAIASNREGLDINDRNHSRLFRSETIRIRRENGEYRDYEMDWTEKFTLFNLLHQYVYTGDTIWSHVDVLVDERGPYLSGLSILEALQGESSDNAWQKLGFRVDFRDNGKVDWVAYDRAGPWNYHNDVGNFDEFFNDNYNDLLSDPDALRTLNGSQQNDIQSHVNQWRRSTDGSAIDRVRDFPWASLLEAKPEIASEITNLFINSILEDPNGLSEQGIDLHFNNTENGTTQSIIRSSVALNMPHLVNTRVWNRGNYLIFISEQNEMHVLEYGMNSDGKYEITGELLQGANIEEDELAERFLAMIPTGEVEATEIPEEVLIDNILPETLELPITEPDEPLIEWNSEDINGSRTRLVRVVTTSLRNSNQLNHDLSEVQLATVASHIAGVIEQAISTGYSGYIEASYSRNEDEESAEIHQTTYHEAEDIEMAALRTFMGTFAANVTYRFETGGEGDFEYDGTPENQRDLRYIIYSRIDRNKEAFFSDPSTEDIDDAVDYIYEMVLEELEGKDLPISIRPEFIINDEYPDGHIEINTNNEMLARAMEALNYPVEFDFQDSRSSNEHYGFIQYNPSTTPQLIRELVDEKLETESVWSRTNRDELFVEIAGAEVTRLIVEQLQGTQEGALLRISFDQERAESEPVVTIDQVEEGETLILAAAHSNIDTIAFNSASEFFRWNGEETRAEVQQSILDSISVPTVAAGIVIDYAHKTEAQRQEILSDFAEYLTSQTVEALEAKYPGGFDGIEFSFTYERNDEYPAGTVEIQEPEQITAESSLERLKNNLRIPISVDGYQSTTRFRERMRGNLITNLLENEDRYFDDPGNPNNRQYAETLATEWVDQIANKIEADLPGYNGRVEVAIEVSEYVEGIEIEIENQEQALASLIEAQESTQTRERWEENRENLGILGIISDILGLNKDDVAAEMTTREENGSLGIFGWFGMVAALFSSRFGSGSLRTIDDIAPEVQPAEAPAVASSAPEEPEEQEPSITDEYTLTNMDNAAMQRIHMDAPPASRDVQRSQPQGYAFSDYEMIEGSEIRLISGAKIEVDSPTDLTGVEFYNAAGDIVRPILEDGVAEFDEDVFIRSTNSAGERTNLHNLRIAGILLYYSGNPNTEPVAEADSPAEEDEEA